MRPLLVLGLFLSGFVQPLFGWTQVKNLTDADLVVTLQVSPEESTLLDESTETIQQHALAPIEIFTFHQWDTSGKNAKRTMLVVESGKKGPKKNLVFADNYLNLSRGNIVFEIFDQDGQPGIRAITVDSGKKIVIG